MAIYVNTNLASLMAQQNLANSTSSLERSLQRLSSGLRVNSAADDPSGMAIAESMTEQIDGNNQGIQNANDGVSLAQTAEGALGQIQNNMQTIYQIAVESSNGTVSNTNRSQLQTEVDQLTQEISRIVQTTNFNGIMLLSGGQNLTFQVGADGTAADQVVLDGLDLTSGLNSYASSLSATGTINISTSGGASSVLSALNADINAISNDRARLGSMQNRFTAVVANLTNYVQNLTAARSQIVDTDFAAETANLTQQEILQQAGTSILTQANSLPQAALTLLRGGS